MDYLVCFRNCETTITIHFSRPVIVTYQVNGSESAEKEIFRTITHGLGTIVLLFR